MSRNGGRPAGVRSSPDERAAGQRPWYRAGMLTHALRMLLLLATAVAVYLFFPAPRLPDAAVLERGVVAPNDVIADFAFAIPKTEQELLEDRAEAAAAVPPVYNLSPAVADTVIAGFQSFFARADTVLARVPPEERPARARALLEQNRIAATPGAVAVLLNPQSRAVLRGSLIRTVRETLPQGVLASSRTRETNAAIQIRRGAEERLVSTDSLLTQDRVLALAGERLADAPPGAAELQRLLLIRYFQPTLVQNRAETEAARGRARAAVDPIKASVLRGEKIVGAHEQIGQAEEERLQAYQNALAARGVRLTGEPTARRTVGSVLYNALVLGIFGVLLWLYRRPLYDNGRAMIVFALLVVVVAGAAALIARFGWPPELMPVTFAALIVAVLWDGRVALVLALVLALLVGGQTPFLGVAIPFTAAMGGAAAAFSVQLIQRRSRTWLFISIISLAQIAAAGTIGLLRSRETIDVIWSMGWGVTNAVIASLLAIGFLPLLEAFTRITTNQTLLELSDLNRPLLRRLSLEAPGTYAHTISVANLAEAACNAIGANGLLARVGTYYHDIGKLVKPQYFIENQPKGRNPHDKFKPITSAGIIRSHVLDGMKLADEERLPAVVRQFITEHHGDQRISFFYDRAREHDPQAQLNPGDYSYPGPRPQTRETAILMLADSVESATRALQDPTLTRIRELVNRIVQGKISSGQLDQSPLTLRELDVVKEHFVKVLSGMYHHRIDYPPHTVTPPPEPTAAAPAADGEP